MIKKVCFFLLLLCSAFLASAQFNNTNSLLWEIKKKGNVESSYFVLVTGDLCDIPQSLLDRILGLRSNIHTYYMESALSNKKSDSRSAEVMFLKKKEPSIRGFLTDKEYDRLRERMREMNIDEKTLNKMTPVFIENLLKRKAAGDCNKTNVIAKTFSEYAGQYGIEVKELVDFEHSVANLLGVPNEWRVERIKYFLANETELKADLAKKAACYEQEDTKGIIDLYSLSRFLRPSETDMLRAKELCPLIEAADKGGVLFTVDLINLADNKNNLFDLLQQRGYQMSPIN
ncbi:TraB/GumN family protein [Sphingobacterium sp. DR205]|uniref:TraB/GumN family protein n=1 Tax=Sphingobacterium sp. DR205 TaxID=2713573 RepID=UPI0013E46FC6|nr:TraB/GumN family protein [Sphingobacterium sp. DR205]QIH32260.1 TraB/GumN family protein [Sphingobacterium sp. DR205]